MKKISLSPDLLNFLETLHQHWGTKTDIDNAHSYVNEMRTYKKHTFMYTFTVMKN